MKFLTSITVFCILCGCRVSDDLLRCPESAQNEVCEKVAVERSFVEIITSNCLTMRPTELTEVTINSNTPGAFFGVFTSEYCARELRKPPPPSFRNDLPPHFLISGQEENFCGLDLRAPVPDDWALIEPRFGFLNEIGRAGFTVIAKPFAPGRTREFYLVVALDLNGDGKVDIATHTEPVVITTTPTH